MGLMETASVNDERRPVVSVCIANYNGESLLDACIGSVLAQENAPTFEIIVHDDASTDASLAVLGKYPDVHVIQSAGNVGFCIGNNRMAEVAKGEFLLLLNNDATLLPDALRTLLDESLKRKHLAVLGMPQYDALDGSLIDRGCWLDCFLSPVPRTSDDATPPTMVIGACMWMHRRIWDDVGGFPEFFGTNAEDVYLCCAARGLGYEVGVTCSSGFKHWVGATQGGGRPNEIGRLRLNKRRRFLSERNRALACWVFRPNISAITFTMINWVLLVFEGIVLAWRMRDVGLLKEVYFASQVSALRDLPQAMRSKAILRAKSPGTWRNATAGGVIVPAKMRMLLRHGLPIG